MVTKSFWVDRVKIAIYQSIPSPYYFNVIGTFFLDNLFNFFVSTLFCFHSWILRIIYSQAFSCQVPILNVAIPNK